MAVEDPRPGVADWHDDRSGQPGQRRGLAHDPRQPGLQLRQFRPARRGSWWPCWALAWPKKSGMLSAMVRGIVMNAPKHLVTVAVVFAGVISNTASEMGYVVLVPLAGAVFLLPWGAIRWPGWQPPFCRCIGRAIRPIFCWVRSIHCWPASPQEAARLVDPTYEVYATANWYYHDHEHFSDHGRGFAGHHLYRRTQAGSIMTTRTPIPRSSTTTR